MKDPLNTLEKWPYCCMIINVNFVNGELRIYCQVDKICETPCRVIIKNHNIVAVVEQSFDKVTANKTGATRYKCLHVL